MTRWPSARDVRGPLGDDVQLWRVPLDDYSTCVTALRSDLADDERVRAAGFASQRLRDRYVVAHAALRSTLGRALGRAPKDIRFSFGLYGKPALAEGSPVGFSLSHSDDLAVVALTSGRAVGVDIERERLDVAHEHVVRCFFSRAEADVLLALPPAERRAAFFRGWTRKEAFVKMLGLGVSHPLDAFDVTLRPNEPARVLATRPEHPNTARFGMADLDLGAGYAGAVAVESTPFQIRCWEWVP